jgi:integrase
VASLSYDARGIWRVWHHDGSRRRSEIVARGRPGPRPKKAPPEATARLAELQILERDRRRYRPKPDDAERSLSDFLDADFAREHSKWRPKTRERSQATTRLLLRFATLRKIRRAVEFEPDHARGFLEWRSAQGVRGNTLAVESACLAAIWSRAVTRRELTVNPWVGVGGKNVPGGRTEPPRPAWTVEEFARVHNQARPWLKRLLVFGTRTGLRVTELISAERGWLEYQGETPVAITVPASLAKSGRSRRIPLHRDARAVVESVEWGDEPHILRGQGGQPIRAKGQVDRAIRQACERAGLPRVGTHAVRRSAGRWMVLGKGPWEGRPIPMYVVQRFLGHASLQMTQQYISLDESSSDQWMNQD